MALPRKGFHHVRRFLLSIMAERRMISLEVVDTDAFLDMPQSSQLLYFHLSIRADDDGFVANPRKIARSLGAGVDDMKVLITKKFVIAFEDGVCVIKHWRINNFIRKDIYKETKYLNLKQTLFIRPNGAYTLTDDGNAIPIPKGHFQLESVNVALTERQLSIGKGSVDKVSEDKNKRESEDAPPSPKDFFEDKLKQDDFIQWLVDEKKVAPDAAALEVHKFISYWTERSSLGKERWRGEKYFDIKRRLATWLMKAAEYSKAKRPNQTKIVIK